MTQQRNFEWKIIGYQLYKWMLKTLSPFISMGANMSPCFTLLIFLFIKFKFTLWIPQVEIQKIFSLVGVSDNLTKCHLQIESLENFIFLNKNWPNVSRILTLIRNKYPFT
jgi:hypothetical protein